MTGTIKVFPSGTERHSNFGLISTILQVHTASNQSPKKELDSFYGQTYIAEIRSVIHKRFNEPKTLGKRK